jgi:hypothetical protein
LQAASAAEAVVVEKAEALRSAAGADCCSSMYCRLRLFTSSFCTAPKSRSKMSAKAPVAGGATGGCGGCTG